jgi:hypothetical protein
MVLAINMVFKQVNCLAEAILDVFLISGLIRIHRG